MLVHGIIRLTGHIYVLSSLICVTVTAYFRTVLIVMESTAGRKCVHRPQLLKTYPMNKILRKMPEILFSFRSVTDREVILESKM